MRNGLCPFFLTMRMTTHGEYEIEILDNHGRVIGTKRRQDVDKTKDILHVVYIFVVTPDGKLILSRIPRNPAKKNLFPGKLGVTVATIVRSGEAHEDAAKRAVAKELGVEGADVTFLGETLESFTGIPKRLVAAYVCTLDEASIKPNSEDVEELVPVTHEELKRLLDKPNNLAPTLLVFWDRYNESFD